MFEGNSSQLWRRFALPQMIGLLFNSIYIIVDGLFIGNVLGRDALAAAGVGVPLVEILISLSMAVASGAGILISTYLPQKNETAAVRYFNTAVLTALIISLLIAILGNIFIEPIALLLGSTGAILSLSVTYLRWIITFCPFMVFSYLLGGMVRNDGRPKLAMTALTIGSLSNIVLDFVFMVPLHLGIGGAAAATAIGPVLSDLLLLPHFLKRKGKLHFARISFSFHNVSRILKRGFPAFIMEFTIGIITFFYNAAIKTCGFGEIGLAAYLIIGYLMLIILTLFLGCAEGLQPVFSHFAGTAEKQRSRDLCRFTARLFFVTGMIAYVLIFFFARYFYLLFAADDPQLITFMVERSRPYFFGIAFAGINILMISYWQSVQKTRASLLVSLLRSLLFPPVFILSLPYLINREALWHCWSLSELCTCFIVWLMIRYERKADI